MKKIVKKHKVAREAATLQASEESVIPILAISPNVLAAQLATLLPAGDVHRSMDNIAVAADKGIARRLQPPAVYGVF